jgi:DNA-binding NtrC family response regulator
LPLELQPKLLRALESREVRRVGSNRPRSVNVRIVAATNRSLLREVEHGAFREDLYYRLAVVTARLPPLRERGEDIPMLVRHFESTRSLRMNSAPLPDAVVTAFAAQVWPGNVRELRNAVERLMSLGCAGAESAEPDIDALARTLHVTLDVPLLVGRERLMEAYEKAYVDLALKQTGGNICRAAEISGVGRKFIQRAMKRYGMRGPVEG